MTVVVWVFALLAAVVHLLVFVWEAFLITRPAVHQGIFGVPTADVPAGSSYRVIGQVMTVKEIVAALTRGLGRDIAYHDIPDRAWADMAATRLNPHALAHLS